MTLAPLSMSSRVHASLGGDDAERPPAITVRTVSKRYHSRRGGRDVVALDGVTFDVPYGSTLGIVGESGSGKSTLARCILGLTPTDDGEIRVLGTSISSAGRDEIRNLRADMQIVFQEPFESLDPRIRVGEAIAEPIKLREGGRRGSHDARVIELLQLVALNPDLASRYPHQLSGGQQQRVNIARALATNPAVLVLDEPTSSLDVSIRSEILQLLASLQEELGLTYVLISHDLSTIRAMSTDIAVMYLGRIVEHGPVDTILESAQHPYTLFLLESELSLDPDVRPNVPEQRLGSGDRPVSGCGYADRCSTAVSACAEVDPILRKTDSGSKVACHLAKDADDASSKSGAPRSVLV